MKKTYTKEEKKAYFDGLRQQWRAVKNSITPDVKTQVDAIMMERGLNFSVTSWILVEQQMKALNLEGLPYVDTKTYQGWKERGFQVKKGEKSKINGITWITAGEKEDGKNDEDGKEEKNGYAFPKVYHLFHNSQVEQIAA